MTLLAKNHIFSEFCKNGYEMETKSFLSQIEIILAPLTPTNLKLNSKIETKMELDLPFK